MTQKERRLFLIRELLKENPSYENIKIPSGEKEQKNLLRSLFNVRNPAPATKEFLTIQDAYLQEEISKKGITDFSSLTPGKDNLYLWKGDITTLRCDAIVNAANSRLLGCFIPCHLCIDNQIHTFGGIQLRLACDEQMTKQGREEETGKAKITPAFNLPCEYVIHTVGPIVKNAPTKEDKTLLASCYSSCLSLAEKNNVKSIAFCCISTGEFRFPQEPAARIAIDTIEKYLKEKQSEIKVIFNVFKDTDLEIYSRLLRSN